MSDVDPSLRAERLLRWYPRNWRARYGDEFGELLMAEIQEQPRSHRRSANVAWSGLVARLSNAGLTKHTSEPLDQVRTSLASLGCALAIFFGLGVSMWSQLTVGWQWSAPDTGATYAAMILMSGAALLFFLLTVLAAAPIIWRTVKDVLGGRSPDLVRPTFLFLAGLVILAVGSRHFGNGWPGTGGHPWAGRGIVPGGVAAFAWASTLSVSSYWAHPHALLSFPIAELVWMAVSPTAIVSMVVGATKIIRRVSLSGRLLRYEVGVARVAGLGMIALFVGSSSWTIDGGPGPNDLFRTGGIDVAALVAMVPALLVAELALQRARQASLTLERV
jgi:hypothetical protein